MKWVHRLSEVDTEKKAAVCANCGPVTIYYANKGGGRFVWHCIEKRRAQHRKWQQSEKGKAYAKKYHANWDAENKDKRSAINRRRLLKYHGLTTADYERMVQEREGRCDLCGEVAVPKLFVDHDHKTLAIRGLLCRHCNLALGFFKDRPDVAARVPSYLSGNLSPEEPPIL